MMKKNAILKLSLGIIIMAGMTASYKLGRADAFEKGLYAGGYIGKKWAEDGWDQDAIEDIFETARRDFK